MIQGEGNVPSHRGDFVHYSKGEIRPHRFRVQLGDEPEQVIKVDKIISKQAEKLAGNPMILYKCQRLDGDDVRYFDLKYELNICRWILFRL